MNPKVTSSLVMGMLCLPVGILVGIYVWRLASGEGYHLFPIYAGLAAFSTAFLSWWFLVARRDRYRIGPGAVAGALSGVAGHYVCWYAQILAQNICHWTSGGCLSSLGEPPIDPLNGLWAALVLSFWSLLLLGWVTAPAGALIGAFWAHRMRRGTPSDA